MSDRTTILIVDDNRELVTATGELLELEGYAAIPAYSAREALDLLDDLQRIDLVLADIRMPDVDARNSFWKRSEGNSPPRANRGNVLQFQSASD